MALSSAVRMVTISIIWDRVETRLLVAQAPGVSAIGIGGVVTAEFYWFPKEGGFGLSRPGDRGGRATITRRLSGWIEKWYKPMVRQH